MAGVALFKNLVRLQSTPRSFRVKAIPHLRSRIMSSPVHTSHEERTSHEPRDKGLHEVTVDRIDQINDNIRLFRLGVTDRANGIKFNPGQWLDVHVPDVDKAGGFTITSTPAAALPQPSSRSQDSPFLDLAIQYSPRNPPAAWMWQDINTVLGRKLRVRVGGSFVWPPAGGETPKKVLFVAGGVGINPLISIVSHLHETKSMPEQTTFFYASKTDESGDDAKVLFLPRLKSIAEAYSADQFSLELYLTGSSNRTANGNDNRDAESISRFSRRIATDDLQRAVVSGKTRHQPWAYICGPQQMTDQFVDNLSSVGGMDPSRVLCEKWW